TSTARSASSRSSASTRRAGSSNARRRAASAGPCPAAGKRPGRPGRASPEGWTPPSSSRPREAVTSSLRSSGRGSGARPQGGRNRASAHLRHAAHLRLLVASCRRLPVHTLKAHGNLVAMIDATYGHLAPDAEEQERALLDA